MDDPLAAKSELSSATATSVTTYGMDLVNEIMGSVDFGAMVHLALVGRVPDAHEARLFNACLVTLVEHGLTPSTIACRLTHFGAPESLQGAVAAGLLGLGSTLVGSIGETASMLGDIGRRSHTSLDESVRAVLLARRAAKMSIPGVGHMLHRPHDPRAERLFEIATEESLYGEHCRTMRHVQAVAEELFDRQLPINATGAIAAVGTDMGLSPTLCQGLGIIARSAGLVAHLAEEQRHPLAAEVWRLVTTGPERPDDHDDK